MLQTLVDEEEHEMFCTCGTQCRPELAPMALQVTDCSGDPPLPVKTSIETYGNQTMALERPLRILNSLPKYLQDQLLFCASI